MAIRRRPIDIPKRVSAKLHSPCSDIITEIPYQVNKATMVAHIGELHREKKIEGIAELRDESDRDGLRIVVELKRDAIADVVLNQLYRFTALQTNFAANMLALDSGRPQ